MLPMIEALQARNTPWRLIYLGRNSESMAYTEELRERFPTQVNIWSSSQHGRINLSEALSQQDEGTHVYACGPAALLNDLQQLCTEQGLGFTAERFQAQHFDTAQDHAFNVVLESSGKVVAVAKDESILKALAREGIHVLSTCQEGTCGSCEVKIVEGQAIHRDSVLTEQEKLANQSLMVCVSRCAGKKIRLRL